MESKPVKFTQIPTSKPKKIISDRTTNTQTKDATIKKLGALCAADIQEHGALSLETKTKILDEISNKLDINYYTNWFGEKTHTESTIITWFLIFSIVKGYPPQNLAELNTFIKNDFSEVDGWQDSYEIHPSTITDWVQNSNQRYFDKACNYYNKYDVSGYSYAPYNIKRIDPEEHDYTALIESFQSNKTLLLHLQMQTGRLNRLINNGLQIYILGPYAPNPYKVNIAPHTHAPNIIVKLGVKKTDDKMTDPEFKEKCTNLKHNLEEFQDKSSAKINLFFTQNTDKDEDINEDKAPMIITITENDDGIGQVNRFLTAFNQHLSSSAMQVQQLNSNYKLNVAVLPPDDPLLKDQDPVPDKFILNLSVSSSDQQKLNFFNEDLNIFFNSCYKDRPKNRGALNIYHPHPHQNARVIIQIIEDSEEQVNEFLIEFNHRFGTLQLT